jgi:hypothetical protein
MSLSFKYYTFVILITISTISFVLGVVGFCCNKYYCAKYTALPIIYGILLSFLWVTAIIYGVFVLAVS